MPTDRIQLRLAAVDAAVRIDANELGPRRVGVCERTRDVLTAADQIYGWLAEPAPVARLIGRIGPLIPISEGNPMANPQVPVGYSFTVTIEPEDTLGNEVSDSLTWSSSDETDAPVTADPTSLIGTVVVVNPAVDTVVTATDGTNTYEYTFDGVADTPVALIGTVGVPFKTAAATPAA
jgi:hypothetical protein